MGRLRAFLFPRTTSDKGDRSTSEQDYGAQAAIEAADIDQMIEARNEIRRRTGREEIGEELSREALRRPPAR